jgi:hypothetical protein
MKQSRFLPIVRTGAYSKQLYRQVKTDRGQKAAHVCLIQINIPNFASDWDFWKARLRE